jgi:TPP-dependent pyruvate/acetoin dehydrogenase alpha subunit
MITKHTKKSLIAFEDRIAGMFHAGELPYAIHFSGGNEDALLGIFEKIKKSDWVFGQWRSHYQSLLKGIPEKELEAMIKNGRSMHVMSKEHRFFASAIVGGHLPIAVGVAQSIKRRGGKEMVHCFLGDGACDQGIFWESFRYAMHHELPIRFIVENNDISVDTKSSERMGRVHDLIDSIEAPLASFPVSYYHYVRKYPHVQTGRMVAAYSDSRYM